jgi:ketosteroid isomerase-like protein
MTREYLCRLATGFTESFNRDDLDGVMSYFADDSLYCEYDGRISRGLDEIRKTFEPQFRGDFGKIRFLTEDLFADAESGKVMIRWECVSDHEGKHRVWRGLDLLHFVEGRLTEKHTYAKAERLKVEDGSPGE